MGILQEADGFYNKTHIKKWEANSIKNDEIEIQITFLNPILIS